MLTFLQFGSLFEFFAFFCFPNSSHWQAEYTTETNYEIKCCYSIYTSPQRECWVCMCFPYSKPLNFTTSGFKTISMSGLMSLRNGRRNWKSRIPVKLNWTFNWTNRRNDTADVSPFQFPIFNSSIFSEEKVQPFMSVEWRKVAQSVGSCSEKKTEFLVSHFPPKSF